MVKFKSVKPRRKKPPIESIRPVKRVAITEPLTGLIKGAPAESMAEERMAKELDKSPRVAGYEYNFIIGTEGLPGWKKLDFLIFMVDGRTSAFSIKDLTFIHKGETAVAEDKFEEQYIIEQLRSQSIYINKVTTIDALDLDTQELAAVKVKEIL